MKLIGMREAREKFAEFVEQAQSERVVVTRHGRPALLLVGIEGEDLEQVLEDERWRRLAKQRAASNEDAMPIEEVARELGLVGSPGRWRPKERAPKTTARRTEAVASGRRDEPRGTATTSKTGRGRRRADRRRSSKGVPPAGSLV